MGAAGGGGVCVWGGGAMAACARRRGPPARQAAPPLVAVLPQPVVPPPPCHAGQWARGAAGSGRVAAEGSEEAPGGAGPGRPVPSFLPFVVPFAVLSAVPDWNPGGGGGEMEPAGPAERGAVRELRWAVGGGAGWGAVLRGGFSQCGRKVAKSLRNELRISETCVSAY